MYEIIFSETARNDIIKLNKPSKEKLISVLERLYINPSRYVKRVIGDNSYKLRFGVYKIILEINKDTISILKVIKGKDVKNV